MYTLFGRGTMAILTARMIYYLITAINLGIFQFYRFMCLYM